MSGTGYETESDGMRLREHAARLDKDGKSVVASFWRDMADRIDERNANLNPVRRVVRVG